jgi:hypothetical protein
MMASSVASVLLRSEAFRNIFDDIEMSTTSLIKNKIKFLMKGFKYFKRSDLAVMHKRLQITDSIFNEFVQSFKQNLNLANSDH